MVKIEQRKKTLRSCHQQGKQHTEDQTQYVIIRLNVISTVGHWQITRKTASYPLSSPFVGQNLRK